MSTTATTITQEPDQLQAKATSVPSGAHTTEIVFFKDPADGSKPFNYVHAPPPGQPQNNYGADTQAISVKDLRHNEDAFALDTAGFAAVRSVPSSLKYEDWDDDELVKERYYPEVEKLLLAQTPGASRVLIFDHTIRRTRSGSTRAPVIRAHIDQTTKSALARVQHHLPVESDTLSQGRVRLINVWRPLKGPVEQFPLAMADSRTVPAEDLVAVEHRYPDRVGETAGVRYSEGQQWYYWSGMGEEERILLQCFDSHGSRARVAHTAVVDHRTPEERGRESIEVRALVFG